MTLNCRLGVTFESLQIHLAHCLGCLGTMIHNRLPGTLSYAMVRALDKPSYFLILVIILSSSCRYGLSAVSRCPPGRRASRFVVNRFYINLHSFHHCSSSSSFYIPAWVISHGFLTGKERDSSFIVGLIYPISGLHSFVLLLRRQYATFLFFIIYHSFNRYSPFSCGSVGSL